MSEEGLRRKLEDALAGVQYAGERITHAAERIDVLVDRVDALVARVAALEGAEGIGAITELAYRLDAADERIDDLDGTIAKQIEDASRVVAFDGEDALAMTAKRLREIADELDGRLGEER
jgi:hypothetical protein